MKYYLLFIEEVNGEQEYNIPYLFSSETDKDPQKLAKKIASAWYDNYNGSPEWNEECECYYFFCGDIAVSVKSIEELTKEHYDILKSHGI